MSVGRHLEETAARLEDARRRIEAARTSADATLSPVQREWLDALSEYVEALSDLQIYANESVHEKLHELAARMGVPWERPPAVLPPNYI